MVVLRHFYPRLQPVKNALRTRGVLSPLHLYNPVYVKNNPTLKRDLIVSEELAKSKSRLLKILKPAVSCFLFPLSSPTGIPEEFQEKYNHYWEQASSQ